MKFQFIWKRWLSVIMTFVLALSLLPAPIALAYDTGAITDGLSVSCGGSISAAIDSQGVLWTWGQNYSGELGLGNSVDMETTPQKCLTDVLAVSAGYNHMAAIKKDRTLWTWGSNSEGQLGIGSTTNSSLPVQVKGLSNVVAVSAGARFTAAVTADGSLYTWGINNSGKLGNGSTKYMDIVTTPTKIMSGVKSVSLGNSHGIALKTDGTVWTWGGNGSGELGNGTTQNSSSPVPVSGVRNVISISAGYDTSAAITADHTLWMWGYNSHGELGTGTSTADSAIPVKAMENVESVSAGGYVTMAVDLDGNLWSWGWSREGALGVSGKEKSLSRLHVMDNVVKAATGSAAIDESGMLWMWGHNGAGQVGNGRIGDKIVSGLPCQTVPVQIKDLGNQFSGFSAEKNGWPVVNTEYGFGYGDGYRIPPLRYLQVFGNLSSLLAGSICLVKEWNGNCYGMSLLAAAVYNGQVNLDPYFSRSSNSLHEYGFEAIARDNQNHDYCYLKKDSEIVKVVEGMQLAQESEEIKTALVFSDDSHYDDLIKYLNSKSNSPILVTLNGHTVVIESSTPPEQSEEDPEIWEIPIYDPNSPYPVQELTSPKKAYLQEGQRSFLKLNKSNGNWELWRGNEQNEGPSPRDYIRFYDVSKLPSSFFTDLLTYKIDFFPLDDVADAINVFINFSNQDNAVTMSSVSGSPLVQIDADGNVSTASGCSATPVHNLQNETDVKWMVSIPDQPFIYQGEDAAILMQNDRSIFALSHTGKIKMTVDLNAKTVDTGAVGSAADLSLVLQSDTTDYDAIKVDTSLSKAGISIDAGNPANIIVNSSDQTSTADIVLETAGNPTVATYESVPLAKIDQIDITSLIVSGEGVPSPKLETNLPFTDVAKDAYYYDAVAWALANNVTTGVTANQFGPDQTCTRGQVVTFLWRAMGEPESASSRNPFKDVKTSDYYYKAILWAVEQGITTGTSATSFSPNSTCTNAHILTFLWRCLGSEGKTGQGTWYDDAVNWAKAGGILDYSGQAFTSMADCPRRDVVLYIWLSDTASSNVRHLQSVLQHVCCNSELLG